MLPVRHRLLVTRHGPSCALVVVPAQCLRQCIPRRTYADKPGDSSEKGIAKRGNDKGISKRDKAGGMSKKDNTGSSGKGLQEHASKETGVGKPAKSFNDSFKGQLLQSVQERMVRQDQEQERYSIFRQIREASRDRGGSPVWVTPLFIIVGIFGGYYIAKSRFYDPAVASTLPLAAVREVRHLTAPAKLEAAWADFCEVVGEANVNTEEADIASHSGSEWSSHPILESDRPWCIITPGTTEEVSGIMKICHKRRIPVTAYSGGTSLEGHFAATRGGICIDFSRMDRILAIHDEDLDVVVQPAVGWESLNETLGDMGLFFPPDPGPGAMIGGMIGTGCSGTNAYRYGTMRDWVLGLTVVLADGTVVRTKQRPRKSSAGYDLTRTIIGSEGTLGLVTEATLKVTVKPIATSVAVCTFRDVRAAADAARAVVKSGVPVAAVELLDDVQMRCINDAGSTSRRWRETATLFFKFGGTPAGIKEHIGIVKDLARKAGSTKFEFARDDDEATELWSARKEALWSVMAKKQQPGDHVWTTDVAVPISRLPDIVELTKEDISNSGLTGSIVGHVGDGNFHAIILYNDREKALAESIVHRMVKRAIEMEGTATGEHGVGLVKRDYLEHELGLPAVNLMRKMKQAFDPLCLLNCDKIVRAKPPRKDEVKPW